MPSETISTRFDSRPFEEPEIELLRGVELPKVSPRRRHAVLQRLLAALLADWVGDRGEVGTEWRFRLIETPDADRTMLIPDIAYVSVDRMRALTDEQAEEPPFAPDVAIEIRSPGDRERNILAKVALYLAAGAQLVIDVDPERHQIAAFDHSGERVFSDAAEFAHELMPGFHFMVHRLFADAERRV
jgi:Uma2 family endonuclease